VSTQDISEALLGGFGPDERDRIISLVEDSIVRDRASAQPGGADQPAADASANSTAG